MYDPYTITTEPISHSILHDGNNSRRIRYSIFKKIQFTAKKHAEDAGLDYTNSTLLDLFLGALS